MGGNLGLAYILFTMRRHGRFYDHQARRYGRRPPRSGHAGSVDDAGVVFKKWTLVPPLRPDVRVMKVNEGRNDGVGGGVAEIVLRLGSGQMKPERIP